MIKAGDELMLPSGLVEKDLDERIRLTYFSVVEYDDFSDCLDRRVVSIWFGPNEQRSLAVAKTKMRNLFKTKLSDRRWVCGSCAEFFLHLYLGQHGYRQACLYSNLEERSIKKGFDGFYLKDGQYWLMESKSSISGTQTHLSKVEEAYRDLTHKLNAFDDNDPWENALHHAISAGAMGSIISQIRSLSDDFTLQRMHQAKEFNMIPCGTVFIDRPLTGDQVEELSSASYNYFQDKDFAELHIVCVSHSALTAFLKYLDLELIDE